MLLCQRFQQSRKITFCPPAIADGADINPLTREEVSEMRRRWFADFRRLTGRHFKTASTDERQRAKPVVMKEKPDRIASWVPKIQAHAIKYTEKTARQRPWSIVAGWDETQLRTFIAGSGAANYKKLLRIFDLYLDEFRPGRSKGPPQ